MESESGRLLVLVLGDSAVFGMFFLLFHFGCLLCLEYAHDFKIDGAWLDKERSLMCFRSGALLLFR